MIEVRNLRKHFGVLSRAVWSLAIRNYTSASS